MSLDDEKKLRIKQLVEELNRYANEYYVLDNSSISDKAYDEKYYELVALEGETNYILSYSPSQRIGDGVLKVFEKYTHKAKLWSLDKAQSISEIKEWDVRNKKAVSDYNLTHIDKLPKLKYIATKKFDGLTINCTYDENGILVRAASRGTGSIGEDITGQVKTIKSLPLKINNSSVIEVHGEAVMTKKAFEEYNKKALIPLKNLRNGAAGALRNLNIKETNKRNLSSFFYDISYNEGTPFKSYIEMMEFLIHNGFPVDRYIKVCECLEDIEKEIEYVNGIRSSLNYDIDGVVFVVDDIRTRNILGYTIKFPKWAIAFKFEAEEATTKLLDVEWNVGRSGRVSPSAILEPVELAGVTVKRATLNNMDDVNRKGVRIGCDVFIRRSNDVIPEIMGVVESSINGSIEILPPEKCPYCGSKVIQDGVHYYCENTLSCKPQLVKSIVHFGQREAMNIEGFSEKTAEQLFEKLDIKSISDLYRIKKEQLLTLERFADKKAQNLIDSIEKSKDCELSSFIFALGIPNVGKKTSDDLSKRFKSFENIQKALFEELISVQDIGDIVAISVQEFFKQDKIKKSIEELISIGVAPHHTDEEVVENVFQDKIIVVTGSLVNYTRTEIKDKLDSLGANVSGSVSKKTNYVLAGSDPGSKYNKALELSIKILTEEEFEKML